MTSPSHRSPTLCGIFVITAFTLLFFEVARAEFSRGLSYQGNTQVSRFDQRKQYQRALYYAKTGQKSNLLKIRDKLRTYPLYPYIEYNEKIYNLSRQKTSSVLAFIEQYSDTPLAERMRQNWLYSLAKKGRWKEFLNHAEPLILSERNACYYGYALYKEGQTAAAMQWAGKLWLVDHSQPDECDPIFKIWREQGHLTADIAWQRYSLAIESGAIKLATYLTRFLDREDKVLASLYRSSRSRPDRITSITRRLQQHPRAQQVMLYGVSRLARTNPELALSTLHHFASNHQFDPEALTKAYVKIGISLASESEDASLIEDLPINLHQHPDLLEARARMAIRQGQWSQVLIFINLLPDNLKESAGWKYWRATVLASDPRDQAVAQEMFTELARTRNFYGFLAADRLSVDYQYVDQPSQVTEEEILSLESTPGIQRALELLTLSDRVAARREWYFATRSFSNKERMIAARVAQKWGWYKPAIQSLIDAKAWNDLELRFPLAYEDNFLSNARVADIPVYWSMAIARQESAFMPDAKSPVGAYGLMQLMPATARQVARELSAPLKSNTDLTVPAINIKLGSHYLGAMLRRFNNNRILASAAYNAGPRRVDKWLANPLPMDVWIESIPYKETRNYVQNVLMFAAIYAQRMHQHQPFIYANERAFFTMQLTTNAN